MAEAIRKAFLTLFLLVVRFGTAPAQRGWRRSKKKNDLRHK